MDRSEPTDSAWSVLEKAIERNWILLSQADGADAVRHRACDDLLFALVEGLQALDQLERKPHTQQSSLSNYEHVWSAVYVDSGLFSNSQLRHALLRTLQTTQEPTRVQRFLLERLPTVMPGGRDPTKDSINRQVIKILTEIWNPLSHFGILETFVRLSLTDQERDYVTGLALQSLLHTDDMQLGKVMRYLVYLLHTEEQIGSLWTALRQRVHELQHMIDSPQCCQTLTNLVHELCFAFQDAQIGHTLSAAYVAHVACESEPGEGGLATILDIIVVTILAAEEPEIFSESVGRILQAWLDKESCPFGLLSSYLSSLSAVHASDETAIFIRRRLLGALVSQLVPLILAPGRIESEDTIALDAESIVLAIYSAMDHEGRVNLIQSLLTLLEQKRLAKVGHDHSKQSIEVLLGALAESSLAEFGTFKRLLTDRLLSPPANPGECDGSRHVCRLLVRLVSSDSEHSPPASQELLKLSNRLLSSTWCGPGDAWNAAVAGDTAATFSGIVLVSEMFRSAIVAGNLSSEERSGLKDQVLRILLPTTRHTVSPKVGLACLDFLRDYISTCPESKLSIFHVLKSVLAYTGLVQRPGLDRQEAIVKYSRVPPQFACRKTAPKPMQLCVSYYMRRVCFNDAAYWKDTALWLFNLLELYLRLGREVTPRSWRFEGWLLAGVVYPDSIPSDVKDHLGGPLALRSSDTHPSGAGCRAFGESGEAWLETIDSTSAINSLRRYAFSRCVALSVSVAVLNHAFEHGNDLGPVNNACCQDDRRLLQWQLWKLFDMRRELHETSELLRVLRKLLERASTRLKRKRRDGSKPDTGGEEVTLIAAVDAIAMTLREFDRLFFLRAGLVQESALWACLLDPNDEDIILHLRPDSDALLVMSSRASLDFRNEQASHLVAWFEANGYHNGNDIVRRRAQCFRLCQHLVSVLPSLRKKSYTAATGFEEDWLLSQSISLTVSLLRLLLFLSLNDTEVRTWIIANAFEWLTLTDDERIACCVLDLLGTAVAQLGGELAEKVVGLSWVSLHTIYAGEAYPSPCTLEPFIVSSLRMKSCHWSDWEGRKLRLMLDESLSTLTNVNASFMGGPTRLVLHFALLIGVGFIDRYLQQVLFVVGDVERSVRRLRISAGFDEDENKDSAGEHVRMASPPALPFLNHGTCGSILVVNLLLVVWPLVLLKPRSMPDTEPYGHFLVLSNAFRRLIDVFCESYHALPRKVITGVIQASKCALLAGVSSVFKCLEWRRIHSLVSPSEREFDDGALGQVKVLMEGVASNIIGSTLSLCEFLQGSAHLGIKVGDAGLFQAASKARRAIDRLAVLYNWCVPDYQAAGAPQDLGQLTWSIDTKGFHESVGGCDEKHFMAEEWGDNVNDDSSSEGSFGVAGDWGDSDLG